MDSAGADIIWDDQDEILVVAGPTASGKTGFAVRAAKAAGGEIVSADSMQIYRHMDIGTAKATPAEMDGVPHHMLDVVEPDARFSVADYQKTALACIRGVRARGRKAVVVGGTGLYISSLVYNIRYPEFASDRVYRAQLENEAHARGIKALHDDLARIDPEAAVKIHVNDKKRIIRALEVYRATGVAISEHERNSRKTPPEFRYRLIGLGVERAELYRRIDARVDSMIEQGLEGEARRLMERYGRQCAAFQAIGYKELFAYFDGACTLEEAVAKIKMETRRYAKRQMTWFRGIPGMIWVDPQL